MISKTLIRSMLKKRPRRVHKKQLGSIMIVAGSRTMPGAGILTASAAQRSGAGLVTAAYPSNLSKVYQSVLPEVLHIPLPQTKSGTLSGKAYQEIIRRHSAMDVGVIGPGLSRNAATQKACIHVIQKFQKPLVIDADGLNAMADRGNVATILQKRQHTTVLTPHEGEMARLTKLASKKIIENRMAIAKKFAYAWDVIIVLKGYKTVIANSDGTVLVNETGGPALATAGSGDVLSGIISTMVAQNTTEPFHATAAAVALHGYAGDQVAAESGERSVAASDLISVLPLVLTQYGS